ncbi:hypothetical protein [Vreelandella massiliensis]|uniref:hypothetical protein n=1 Tax=Vreelandella massiliensis TaxID=1816686 RepID=UPI00096A58F0|nr:hypothetical protein [Halomonas massiliensis]
MTTRLFRLDDAIQNADLIYEAAKRLKAAKSRLGNKADKEQEARDALKTLQAEAHSITTAMVNGEDMRDHRDLADVQRELKAAHNKVDKAIEKAHEDKTAIQEALDELTVFLEGDNMDTTTDQEQEAA